MLNFFNRKDLEKKSETLNYLVVYTLFEHGFYICRHILCQFSYRCGIPYSNYLVLIAVPFIEK